MLSTQRLAPLAVALLLVLAGCGAGPSDGTTTAPDETDAPTATDTPASADTATPGDTETPGTATDDEQSPDGEETDDGGETTTDSVQVRNGTLAFDANRTFTRVRELVGSDVVPRPVEIRNLSEWRRSLPRIAVIPLNDALGYENASVNWSRPSGVTQITGYVYIHPGAGPSAAVERVLAHEFTHTIQHQANMLPWLDRLRTQRIEVDQAKVYRALQEGGAVYVADAYAEHYLDTETNSASVRELYETGGPTYRSALAPYVFGAQYVSHVIDSPANLSAVYRQYPRTTEQLLHNETRREEPEANLSVDASSLSSDWMFQGNNTLGELTIRHSLGTELSPDRAAAAAAGWGSDHLSVFQSAGTGRRYGWAWIQRWDNSSEADEAYGALEEYAVARGADGDSDFRTVRISDETTALVFGDPAFVDAASVEGTTTNVTVQIGA